MHVIFNADDFGLSRGVNTGIIESSTNGVVRSTTLMVGMEAQSHGLSLLSNAPNLKLGLHLRLTAGQAFSKKGTLTDGAGHFLSQDNFWPRTHFDESELYEELSLQVDAFKQLGISLSHIDSHHHVHTHPKVFPVVFELAQKHNVPLRGGETLAANPRVLRYQFSDVFYGDSIDVATIVNEIKRCRLHTDVVEFMCHPAHVDHSLKAQSSYHQQRATELQTLISEELQQALHKERVSVTDYSIFCQ